MSFLEPRGVDPALTRLTLAELAVVYGERLARPEYQSERAALVRAWALDCERELLGVDTLEAAHLRSLYRAVFETVAP